jgi:hypothetical protein
MPRAPHSDNAEGDADAASPLSFLRSLRRHHQGVLRVGDDDVLTVRFVLQPSSGQPVLPVPPRVFAESDCVLCLPDDALDNPDCLQLLGTVESVDANREPACDRWLASFGKAPNATWGLLRVRTAKRLTDVLDGGLVCLANPLAREEGALCKRCNAQPQALARACDRQLHVRADKPFAVGVDALGIDVRQAFGLSRLEFTAPVANASEAAAAIDALLAE